MTMRSLTAERVERRLLEIEERLELYGRATRVEESRPESINAVFLLDDVPWLIAQVRERNRGEQAA